jgi:O-acetyl-ADP-ribose deacetylase (regulator of RNase III)
LPADAIIIGQNEALNETSDGNEAIFLLAGPELEKNLDLIAPVQTGHSAITPGYALPTHWIIHSVGPKYDARYLTASDHALFSAYKSALIVAASQEIKQLIISCIYVTKKKFPRFDAAHVALRAVRKFLQHKVGDCFEKIMFCVPTQDDFEIYSALLTAYFPRDANEAINQANLLPENLGDEWGDIVIADRVLKITAGPKPINNNNSTGTVFEQRSISGERLNGSKTSGYKTGDFFFCLNNKKKFSF